MTQDPPNNDFVNGVHQRRRKKNHKLSSKDSRKRPARTPAVIKESVQGPVSWSCRRQARITERERRPAIRPSDETGARGGWENPANTTEKPGTTQRQRRKVPGQERRRRAGASKAVIDLTREKKNPELKQARKID